jgi:hypothetical protein
MKLIEALKKTKDLQRKLDDLTIKIRENCADYAHETPTYGTAEDQRKQVSAWIQARQDILKELLRLRIAIQRTNLATPVTVEIGDRPIVKTIAEWIHRRKDLAKHELQSWRYLTNRGLREGVVKQSNQTDMELKVRMYFDPKQRDDMVDMLSSEPLAVDSALEVANALTDLME